MSYAAAATAGLPTHSNNGGNSNSRRSQRNIVLTRMKNKCQNNTNNSSQHSRSNNNKPRPKAPTVVERLQACLENDKIRDLYLIANDGSRVPALRCVMASASPVLERMLYGDFVEAQQTEIELGDGDCSSKALEALVEFCCSDQLTTTRWQSSCSDEVVTMAMMEDVMSVARLGHTYAIPALQEAVHDLVLPRLQEDPSLACIVLKGSHPMSTPELYAAAMDIIKTHPYMALKAAAPKIQEDDTIRSVEALQQSSNSNTISNVTSGGGITCLPPDQVEEILQEDVECDEFFLFQCLLDWRNHNMDLLVEAADDASEEEEDVNVNTICEQMVRHHIRLACINPEDLKSTVMTCGFVSQELLLEAFMEQALMASKEGHAFGTLRSAPEGTTGGGQTQGHVLVQGAGHAECNGLYTQQRNLSFPPLVYYSRYDFKHDTTYYLVKDRTDPNWKISANGMTFYEWKACEQDEEGEGAVVAAAERGKHVPPPRGWSVHLPCASSSTQESIPTCKFFRPTSRSNKAKAATTTTTATASNQESS